MSEKASVPFVPRLKTFRRQRKHTGKTWTPELPKTDQGGLCRGCGKWRAWGQLYVEYERRGEAFVMLWYCNDCDTLVLELWLGGR